MNKDDKKPHKRGKKVIKYETLALIVGCIALLVVMAIAAFKTAIPAKSDLSYLEFLDMLENSEIQSAKVVDSQDTFIIQDKEGNTYNVINPDYEEFKKLLLENGVEISVTKQTLVEALTTMLGNVPMIILVFILIYYIVKAVGSQTTTLFKVLKPEDIVTFDDVAGMAETKEEVKFAISQLKNHKALKELGARPCKGIILEGPPGTGKTLLAKAIAGEAGVPFISTSGADFVEMFVGLGAARVRALWDLASTNSPCVVFIDEIDAVGRRRSGASDSASTESNQTLNALLQRMDGLGTDSGIFVVAATNRIDDLDPALLRPGRFDKHLYVGAPSTKKDRDELVELYMKGKKFDDTVTLNQVSKLMFGFTGAQIEQALSESVLVSLQRGGEGIVSLVDIDNAVMKVISSGVKVQHRSEHDIKICATHEAGHAVVNSLLGRPVSKVSITPYSSGIGGLTVTDTDIFEDIRIKTKTELEKDIMGLLGGRAAEIVEFGENSIGCSNDIERATDIAYKMIFGCAMEGWLINPDALRKQGVAIINSNEQLEEVNSYIENLNNQVIDMLLKHREDLKMLSNVLISEEVIVDYDINTFKASEKTE